MLIANSHGGGLRHGGDILYSTRYIIRGGALSRRLMMWMTADSLVCTM